LANPKSQALRRTQDRTRAASAAVSFGGRPRPGRGASPASPPARHALSHRHTERSLTSRRSAASPGVSPPRSTMETAAWRTYSNDRAVLGTFMWPIVRHAQFY
jgi:hypothetical protein